MTSSIDFVIPMLILVGILSSFIASMVGLGGGLIAIPLITLIVGDHPTQVKLISYVSVAFLSIVAAIRYIIQKRKPNIKQSLLILLGVVPITVICEIYVSPYFDKDGITPYFHYIYGVIILGVILLVNFKDKIKLNKPLPNFSLPIIGAFIGVLSGSFGLSGGILFVPLLSIGLQYKLKDVAVNSLFLKLGTSLANIFAGIGANQFETFEANGIIWYAPLIIIVGSFIGAQIGPVVNKKLNENQIKIIFNVVLSLIFVWEIINSILNQTVY